jgi:hypothetical protein
VITVNESLWKTFSSERYGSQGCFDSRIRDEKHSGVHGCKSILGGSSEAPILEELAPIEIHRRLGIMGYIDTDALRQGVFN